jgi:hypothetical protein
MRAGQVISQFPRERNRIRASTRKVMGDGLAASVQVQADGTLLSIPGIQVPIPRGLTRPYTCTNADTIALPVDFDRKYLFYQNNDLIGVVWGSFGAPAQIGVGYKFAAGGGGIMLDNNVPTAEFHVIGTIPNNPNCSIITG